MFNSVSMQEFTTILNKQKINLIDVREKDEYVSGHVPTATNYPLSTLVKSYKTLNKDLTYYIICYSGSRSYSASTFLAKQGYKVINVLGGTSSYIGKLER